MPRFKLTLEYAGTRYSGWQIQKNARTVQGELDRAVRHVTGRASFDLQGSGRTDAGVHALQQVAHLDVATTLPPATLVVRLNDELPSDIHVLDATIVSHRFHARHDAVGRSYLYQVSRRRTAFAKPLVWWVREPLDLERMREAATALAGFNDYRAFTDDDPGEKSTKVLVEGITLAEAGPLVLIRVEGSHFLWKMVRRLVGVLVEIGCGRLHGTEVAALLAGPSTLPARLTAPAAGLFLERVSYRGDRRDWPIEPVVHLRG
ncbi:MAG: tRNA pseudouridine(38-40) synthase TruA [Acidobacteria bacterium]|nr:tRNA pseudouridine(38-40) synthase TruA [Acidobacteriota bacterium]